MGLRNALVLMLTAGAAAVLSACASFSIDAPKNGAVVRSPAKTHVVIITSPSMLGVVVRDNDGNQVTDMSSQITDVTDGERKGDLSLAAANHTITAEADVPCWYCYPNPWHASYQTKICVAAETWPAGVATGTALGLSNNLSWAKTSDAAVGVDTDRGPLRPAGNCFASAGSRKASA